MDQMISTGCRPIDDLLDGGIEPGVVTQIYGEAGSGKTNFCLQTAVMCVKSGMDAAEAAFAAFTQRLNALSGGAKDAFLAEYAGSLGVSETGPDRLLSGIPPADDASSGALPDTDAIYGSAVVSAIRRKLQTDLVKKVIYIDTEGLSPVRFGQIAGPQAKNIARHIIIYEPMDLNEQYTAIRDIEKIARLNIGLVIIDSATAYYRYELDDELSGVQSRRELTNQIGFLHNLSRKHGFSALITNQVFSDISGGNNIRAIGGKALEHISKTILFLEKTGTGERKATIVKHRSMPEGKDCRFRITENGLE